MKEEIQKKMKETELELQSMGQGIPQDSDEQRKFISQVVNLREKDTTGRATHLSHSPIQDAPTRLHAMLKQVVLYYHQLGYILLCADICEMKSMYMLIIAPLFTG